MRFFLAAKRTFCVITLYALKIRASFLKARFVANLDDYKCVACCKRVYSCGETIKKHEVSFFLSHPVRRSRSTTLQEQEQELLVLGVPYTFHGSLSTTSSASTSTQQQYQYQILLPATASLLQKLEVLRTKCCQLHLTISFDFHLSEIATLPDAHIAKVLPKWSFVHFQNLLQVESKVENRCTNYKYNTSSSLWRQIQFVHMVGDTLFILILEIEPHF